MSNKSKIHPFFSSKCGHGNVVFNLDDRDPIDDLSIFALGYHMAANSLVKSLESAGKYADYEAYPIFFLYRHSLELYLKAIIYKGARLLGLLSDDKIDITKLLTNHSLCRLLPAIKTIFKYLEWDKNFGIPNIRNFAKFEELINAIEEVDPRSYSFRYPVTTKGDSILPKHFVINAISFGKNMDRILQVLDGAITGLDEHLYVSAEEMRSFHELWE